MNSAEFVHDFTEWIKTHTQLEALYINYNEGSVIFYAETSEKKTFLQNSMIFTGYDYTSYCKLFTLDELPYLEIEFASGNEATIFFVSKDYEIPDDLEKLFDRN